MKATLKEKAQKAVYRIESGDFDEHTIDSLFSALRQYSFGKKVFSELADFIAHPDVRDKGLVKDSLEAFYLRLRFFIEYQSPKSILDLRKPFPSYIIKLFKYQIDKCEPRALRDKFNVSPERLKSRLDNMFALSGKEKSASVKNVDLLRNNINALNLVMSFLYSQPAFEQDLIMEELLMVIKCNDLEVDNDKFLNQSQKIMLSLLLSMHEVEFKYDAEKSGRCVISCERTSILHEPNMIDANGDKVEYKVTFGSLQLQGRVLVPRDGKYIEMRYPILTTNLEVNTTCDKSIFSIGPSDDEHPYPIFRKANFDTKLILTDEGLLGVKSPESIDR